MLKRENKIKQLWDRLTQEQLDWIEKHGGDVAGYIANYHVEYKRPLYEAVAIYQADLKELHRREDRLRSYL